MGKTINPNLSSRTRTTGSMRWCLAVIAAVICTACTSNPWNIQHISLSEGTYAPRTPPERIEVFRSGGPAPTRAHLEVAQVSVRERPLHLPSAAQLSMEATLLQAKQRASELGADAIKETKISVAPTGVYGAGSVSVDGIAIRWK